VLPQERYELVDISPDGFCVHREGLGDVVGNLGLRSAAFQERQNFRADKIQFEQLTVIYIENNAAVLVVSAPDSIRDSQHGSLNSENTLSSLAGTSERLRIMFASGQSARKSRD
jgi:hypothetical protein